jgi:hypothetical protein
MPLFRYLLLALAGVFVLGVLLMMGSMAIGMISGRRKPNDHEKLILRALNRIWWIALGVGILMIVFAVVRERFGA